MTKYKVHERPRVKKKLPKMKPPKGEYPPKYKVHPRPRPSASRKKCCT